MKRALSILALLSLPVLSQARQERGDFSNEDRTECARLEAELRSKEQQYARLQQEIAETREKLSRQESAAHVRAASSVRKSYDNNQSDE